MALTWNGYTIRNQCYFISHFARYTDPEYVRISVDGTTNAIWASAYLAPDNARTTLVILNTGASQRTVGIDPGQFPASKATVYNPGSS